MKEIKDIAMWEETDSELAKYHIQQVLNRIQDLKEQIKELFDEYLELKDRIEKAIEYIETTNKLYLTTKRQEAFDDLLDILRGKDNE